MEVSALLNLLHRAVRVRNKGDISKNESVAVEQPNNSLRMLWAMDRLAGDGELREMEVAAFFRSDRHVILVKVVQDLLPDV
jgi:hypothetical protein